MEAPVLRGPTYTRVTMENNGNMGVIFGDIEPPPGLYTLVLARIALARRRAVRWQLLFQTSLCFVSGMLLVPLAQSIGQEFYTSGFYDYASLFFSTDSSSISNSSQELLYSLIESLPSFALLGACIATSILLWSLRRVILNSKLAFTPLHTV